MLNAFIQRADYVKGLYHSMIMRKLYPKNTFVINSQAMIWHGIAAYEARANDIPYSFSYRKIEGEIQHLYFFLNKLKTDEITMLATQQIWQNSLAYPENQFLQQIRKEVLRDFVSFKENKLGNFASRHREQADTSVIIKKKDAVLNKYDKIAKKRKNKASEAPFYYALIGIVDNPLFQKEVANAEDILQDKEKIEEQIAEKNKKPQKNNMDVETLIMTTPNYDNDNNRKSNKTRMVNNESTENKLLESVKDNAKKLDIRLSYVDNFRDPNFTTENYNEFSMLYDYIGERVRFDGLDFLPYNAQYIHTLTERYDSKYVGILSIYTRVRKRPFSGSYAALSLATIYAFPLYLKWQLSADKQSDYGFYIMNISTHNPAFRSSRSFKANMNIHMQNAHIYNSLNQIRKK